MNSRFRAFLFLTLCLLVAGCFQNADAQKNESFKTFEGRVIVLFRGNAVPSDAADRVKNAGGKVATIWNEIGGLVAEPDSVSGATLLRNLQKDPTVQEAGFDAMISLGTPSVVEMQGGVSPAVDTPPALP